MRLRSSTHHFKDIPITHSSTSSILFWDVFSTTERIALSEYMLES